MPERFTVTVVDTATQQRTPLELASHDTLRMLQTHVRDTLRLAYDAEFVLQVEGRVLSGDEQTMQALGVDGTREIQFTASRSYDVGHDVAC